MNIAELERIDALGVPGAGVFFTGIGGNIYQNR
jgi:hypothetical protein